MKCLVCEMRLEDSEKICPFCQEPILERLPADENDRQQILRNYHYDIHKSDGLDAYSKNAVYIIIGIAFLILNISKQITLTSFLMPLLIFIFFGGQYNTYMGKGKSFFSGIANMIPLKDQGRYITLAIFFIWILFGGIVKYHVKFNPPPANVEKAAQLFSQQARFMNALFYYITSLSILTIHFMWTRFQVNRYFERDIRVKEHRRILGYTNAPKTYTDSKK